MGHTQPSYFQSSGIFGKMRLALLGLICGLTLLVGFFAKLNMTAGAYLRAFPIFRAPALTGDYCRNVVGLHNGGNTCYQNALLQCLLNSPMFPEAAAGDGPLAEALRKLHTALSIGIVPRDTAEVRGAVQPQDRWNSGHQQDSQEFLVALRDQQPPIGAATEIKCDEALTCPQCQGITRQSISVFELSISLDGPTDLRTLLQNHFRPELVPRSCDACDSVQASKALAITTLPRYLIIHLKRFSFDAATLTPSKISTFISCPMLGLVIPTVNGSVEFQLISTVQHGGSTEGGHYWAHVHDSLSDSWFNFNDASATPMTPEAVVNAETYILFYASS